MKGKLIVIVGPSGAGKTAIVDELLKIIPNSGRLITITTRRPRPGEKDGEHYYFISKEEFENKIKDKEFFEHALVHGYLYGSSKEVLRSCLENFKTVFAIIDVQGAKVIKSEIKDSFIIFIHSGTIDSIEKKLREDRIGISEAELQKRLETARHELAYMNDFHANVENVDGKFNQTIDIIKGLITKNSA